jgi:hypothetical protein
LIGECGVDGTIDERNPQWGWQDYGLTRQQYSDQLEKNHRLMGSNVVAMLPFTTDFQGREWRGYNTTPAHNQILAWALAYKGEEEMEKRTGTVTANVLNVRVEPSIKARNVGTLKRGAKVFITQEHVKPDGTVWYKIGFNRWVHGGWVKLDEKG